MVSPLHSNSINKSLGVYGLLTSKEVDVVNTLKSLVPISINADDLESGLPGLRNL